MDLIKAIDWHGVLHGFTAKWIPIPEDFGGLSSRTECCAKCDRTRVVVEREYIFFP